MSSAQLYVTPAVSDVARSAGGGGGGLGGGAGGDAGGGDGDAIGAGGGGGGDAGAGGARYVYYFGVRGITGAVRKARAVANKSVD